MARRPVARAPVPRRAKASAARPKARRAAVVARKAPVAGRRLRAAPNMRRLTAMPSAPALSPFSPLSHLPIPVGRSVGKALALTGMRRNEVQLLAFTPVLAQAYTSNIYFVTNTGTSGTVMANLSTTTVNNVATTTSFIQTIALLNSAAGTAASPTGIRAMKAGVGIVNVTPSLSRGGRVFVLNSDSRLFLANQPSLMTSAQWATVASSIRDHPDCSAFSGNDFSSQKEFFSHIADTVEYENFNNYQGPDTLDTFMEHVATWPGATSETERPMSCVCVLIDPPPANQDYTVSVHGSYYTRWPLNTVANLVTPEVPTASSESLDKMAKAGKAASDPERRR